MGQPNQTSINLFAGRTKNEIRHAYFLAKIFGTTVEQMDADNKALIERDKIPYDPNNDKAFQLKFDKIDKMSHAEYMEYVRDQLDD